MNNMGIDPVKKYVWEEIARNLARGRVAGRCRCWGEEFYRYLLREGDLPFPLENIDLGVPSDPASGPADLIIGWRALGEERTALRPESIHRMLKEGGEALLYGFYSSPTREDVAECERHHLGSPGGLTIRLPLPGAVSLGRIGGWLRTAPFDRYTIRKKGIYYQLWLRKGG